MNLRAQRGKYFKNKWEIFRNFEKRKYEQKWKNKERKSFNLGRVRKAAVLGARQMRVFVLPDILRIVKDNFLSM
jgi:hypothetical protein